jgi:ABC-type glycerol-3-phosphate transport system permease component
MEYISISKGLANWLDFIGMIIFFLIIAAFGIWVFSMFFKNINVLRGKEAAVEGVGEGAH